MLAPARLRLSVPNRLVAHYGRGQENTPNGNWATRNNWLGRDNDAPGGQIMKVQKEWEYDYFFANSEFARKYALDDNYKTWANNASKDWQDYLRKNRATVYKTYVLWFGGFMAFMYIRWKQRVDMEAACPKGLEGVSDHVYFPFHNSLWMHAALGGHALQQKWDI